MQVLTPMRKGPAGVQSLNARLQALLNPPEAGKGEIRVSSAADNPQILRVGDRVIQVSSAAHFLPSPCRVVMQRKEYPPS